MKNKELQESLDKIEEGHPRKKFKGCLKIFIIILIILVIFAILGYFLFFSKFALPGTGLKGESKGQINILVLGIGGEGHSGENLTDTIMLIMIRPKENKMAMLSIPRDLWVNTKGYGDSKINAVYARALPKEGKEKAIGLVENHVKDITDIKPDYYALIDFEGLSEVVETLDGVDVYVDTEFTDTLHKINYKKGKNHFNGEQAVMYTRARYATAGEGSDFQRADRQQDLIMAIKDKAISKDTLFDPSKLSSLSKQYKKHIFTNISIRELGRLKAVTGDISNDNTIKEVYSTSNILVSEKSAGGAYILKPRSGDYSETRAMAKNIFKDNPTVKIFNGTKEIGREKNFSKKLLASGYNILKTADSEKKTYIRTTIFDNSDGRYKEYINKLAAEYNAKIAPGPYISTSHENADIIIVIGDANKKSRIEWLEENFMFQV
ncbi:MAG: cell envelope-related transcriptional attenuator [uncultured bacterium]|nr:MAG: cell envelope-related transcriptional attenuator [uncultured bacterium]